MAVALARQLDHWVASLVREGGREGGRGGGEKTRKKCKGSIQLSNMYSVALI